MGPNEMSHAGVLRLARGDHGRTGGRPNLRREIVLALVIKCALLYGLWWAFFAQAPSKQAIAEDVSRMLSGAAPGATDSHPSKEPKP